MVELHSSTAWPQPCCRAPRASPTADETAFFGRSKAIFRAHAAEDAGEPGGARLRNLSSNVRAIIDVLTAAWVGDVAPWDRA